MADSLIDPCNYLNTLRLSVLLLRWDSENESTLILKLMKGETMLYISDPLKECREGGGNPLFAQFYSCGQKQEMGGSSVYQLRHLGRASTEGGIWTHNYSNYSNQEKTADNLRLLTWAVLSIFPNGLEPISLPWEGNDLH